MFQRVLAMGPRRAAAMLRERILRGPLFTIFEHFGVHVTPNHYYSPMPDFRELRGTQREWHRPWSFVGVDVDIERQFAFLDKLRPHFTPDALRDGPSAFGEGFGAVEGVILRAFMRAHRPRRVIEIGSGHSTWHMIESGVDADIMCIEPYPHGPLRRLAAQGRVTLCEDRAQNVPVAEYDALRPGDLLFIDSTHVVRTGGEVPFLYLDIIPRLKPGVFIHIHDIVFPYHESLRMLLERKRVWMEAALVHALLVGHRTLSIELSTSWLHFEALERFYSSFPFPRDSNWLPASLWLRA